jgi:UDP-N-acetylglucosamine--N-acetylmuramyl-(pentapeptide) pyrophosphoryl-undecaprenol N-acetylglucosamine transferase
MEEVYAVADVAIARSGAASLTEIAYFGLPTILIPYPFAAENHQLLNAEMFARHGSAEVLEESRVSGDTLSSLIDQFLKNGARMRRATEQPHALAPETAANRIAEIVERSRK